MKFNVWRKRYMNKPQENGLKAKVSTLLERLHLLPFRKMKFSSYVYYQQNDLKLVRGLKA
ncbi:hypothetical protein CU098_000365, partial [Rhizopus stolonifer]